MRTLTSVTAKQIAEAIKDNNPNMEARLVTRNKYNQEFLVKLVSCKNLLKCSYFHTFFIKIYFSSFFILFLFFN